MKPLARRSRAMWILLWLCPITLGLGLTACPLPPARICAEPPPGQFSGLPQGWVSPGGTECMPAIDRGQIAKAMQLAALAYGTDDEIRSLGKAAIEEVDVDVGGRSPGLARVKFFIWYDDTAGPEGRRDYLAIRGTANPGNVYLDLKFPQVHDQALDLWAHEGFLAVADKVLERIDEKNLLSGAPLWVTGHSLGGASALLVYLRLSRRPLTLGPLITFGQPRALTDKARERFGCLPIIRVVSKGDFVPLLPPTIKEKDCGGPLQAECKGSFAHLGDELVIRKDGACDYRTYHDARALGLKCFQAFYDDAAQDQLVSYPTDHLPNAYLRRVGLWAEGTSAPPCVFHARP